MRERSEASEHVERGKPGITKLLQSKRDTLNGAVESSISAAPQDLTASGQPPARIACTLALLAMAYEGRPPIEDVTGIVTTGGGENCGGNRRTIFWWASCSKTHRDQSCWRVTQSTRARRFFSRLLSA